MRSESRAPRAEVRRAWQLALALGIGSLAGIGLFAAQAFTLIAVTTLSVTPNQGVSNTTFTVVGTYQFSTCSLVPPPTYIFNFYWDKASATQLLWSTKVSSCDVKTLTYRTGRSPGLAPRTGAAPGRHLIILDVLDAATGGPAPANNTASQGFTVYAGKPFVTVTPTSGVPTAHFTIAGKYVWSGACPPSPMSMTFKFYWYKVATTRVLLWTKTASSCSSGAVSTGTSPSLVPPPGLNYPSTFVIQVAVYSSTGARFGSTYTNTTLYSVLAPPPSPIASPSSTPQCGLPGQLACPSPPPSATPCTQPSAALPPSGPRGPDSALLVGLVVLGAIPIGGTAIVFSPGFLNRRSWARIVAFLWVSMLLLTATGCTAISGPTGQSTPSQAEMSPSPSPTACQA